MKNINPYSIQKICLTLSVIAFSSCSYPPSNSEDHSEENTMVICPACRGTGQDNSQYSDDIMYQSEFGITCSLCNGSGKCSKEVSDIYISTNTNRSSNNGSSNRYKDDNRCVECYGSGKCNMCAGRGYYYY